MSHLTRDQKQYIALVSLSGAVITFGAITLPDFGICLRNPFDLAVLPAIGALAMGYIAYQVVSTESNK